MWKDARCESRSFFCRTLPRTTTVPHRTQTEPSPYPYKSQIVHYTLCDYTFDISTSGLINIFNCTSSIKKAKKALPCAFFCTFGKFVVPLQRKTEQICTLNRQYV